MILIFIRLALAADLKAETPNVEDFTAYESRLLKGDISLKEREFLLKYFVDFLDDSARAEEAARILIASYWTEHFSRLNHDFLDKILHLLKDGSAICQISAMRVLDSIRFVWTPEEKQELKAGLLDLIQRNPQAEAGIWAGLLFCDKFAESSSEKEMVLRPILKIAAERSDKTWTALFHKVICSIHRVASRRLWLAQILKSQRLCMRDLLAFTNSAFHNSQ